MAIIRNSRSFEGSEFKPRSNPYIKSDVNMVVFGKVEVEGVYLFLLGSYKQDTNGNGVWYRPLKIRADFGIDQTKEKFAVQPNCPVEYFASKVRTFAPKMAETSETVDDKGRKRIVYPVWGRNQWRVLYNAAFYGNFGKGVHVLDLPQKGGASVFDEFVRGRQPDGTENPMLNDYQAAIPIHIKLDLQASGMPWKIQINPSKTHQLPAELADTDYLYNLDDVILYPTKISLINKLKSCVPSEVFRKGMEGYSDDSLVSADIGTGNDPEPVNSNNTEDDTIPMSFPKPVEQPRPAPVNRTVAPTVSIPKPNKPKAESVEPDNSEPVSSLPSNPMSRSSVVSAAADYLKGKKGNN